MNRIKKIANNEYIFSIATKFVNMGCSVLQSILVARYLGAELKGHNALITSIVSIGAIIITFGMHQAYPYVRKKYGKEQIYNNYLSVLSYVFILYFLLAVVVSLFVPKIDIRVAILLIPIAGYAKALGYVSLIELPNRYNTLHLIIVGIDLLCVTLLYIFTKSNYFWGIVIVSLLYVLELVVYYSKLKFQYVWKKELFSLAKELYSFGFFPMLALLMTTLNYKVDVLMLRGFPEIITTAQIGIYSVGMSITDRISLIPDTLKGVMISKLAKGADEHEVAKVCRLCFWCSFGICIGLLVIGKPLIRILYGSEYIDAYKVLLICAAGTIFIGYFKLIAQYNIVNKKQIRNVIMLAISVIVNIILNLLLIPRYQLSGAAVASGVGYFLSGIIFVTWFARNNGLKLSEMILIQKSDLLILNSLLQGKKAK
jgi:O-antigen/teichoic acid export membrane protein